MSCDRSSGREIWFHGPGSSHLAGVGWYWTVGGLKMTAVRRGRGSEHV